jgi:hypothetical protein
MNNEGFGSASNKFKAGGVMARRNNLMNYQEESNQQ